MKRALLVLLAGIFGGVLAHVGWFAAHRPPGTETLEAQLAWMQTSLQLTPAQFARIKELHEQTSPRLRELAAQVGHMREEFAAFEHARVTAGQIDFLEFARFVAQRRAVDRECLESTRRLVQAAGAVMTEPQRERYQALLDPVLRAAGGDALN
jgi:hypothetical protein